MCALWRLAGAFDEIVESPLEVDLLRFFHDLGDEKLGQIDAEEVVGELLGANVGPKVTGFFVDLTEVFDMVVEDQEVEFDLASHLALNVVIFDKKVDIGAAALDGGRTAAGPLEPTLRKVLEPEKWVFDEFVGVEDVAVELHGREVKNLELQSLEGFEVGEEPAAAHGQLGG